MSENEGREVLELVAEGDFRPVKLTVHCYDKDGAKTDTKVIEFELFEMDWLSQEKFLNQHNRRLTVNEDNVVVRDFEGMRLDLLTKAMRFKDTGKTVTPEFFRNHRIPSGTVQALYDAAQELNQVQSADPTKWVKLVAATLTKHAEAGKITEDHRALLTKAMETEAAGE
jgi:hypothetical protein